MAQIHILFYVPSQSLDRFPYQLLTLDVACVLTAKYSQALQHPVVHFLLVLEQVHHKSEILFIIHHLVLLVQVQPSLGLKLHHVLPAVLSFFAQGLIHVA